MELKDAIRNRKSVRGYLNTPVSEDDIREILETASRAVSAQNTQPWEVTCVTGEMIEELRKINMELLESGIEPDFTDAPLAGISRERARGIGKKLFAAMDIAREDKEKRNWWMGRGFRFFDAPCVLLLYMDSDIFKESHSRLDMGAFAQLICLAAHEKGLGTCVENQAINFNKAYYEKLDIPETKTFVCGIAIGYEDPDFPANEVRSDRDPVDGFARFIGF